MELTSRKMLNNNKADTYSKNHEGYLRMIKVWETMDYVIEAKTG